MDILRIFIAKATTEDRGVATTYDVDCKLAKALRPVQLQARLAQAGIMTV
jgi:hypothetical protein